MSEEQYFQVTSSKLSDAFPELKHCILSNYDRTLTVKRGAEITRDDDDELLYLAKGKIKAYIYDENGHEQLMYIFIKDTLIFHSISEQFCKNLIALEAASIYGVKYSEVFRFLQQDPVYIERFGRLIAERYGILLQQVLTANHQGAKHKVYAFLISLAHKFGIPQDDGSLLVSKFPTLTDLAAATNVHRSNATAYINDLEAQGIITRDHRKLIINDLDTLEELAERTAAK